MYDISRQRVKLVQTATLLISEGGVRHGISINIPAILTQYFHDLPHYSQRIPQ
jgi:hypothetical protein